ncbi:hypothetical protein P691DRAFT_290098 [Macrolepiota fuliginosa MF-IS2]|uniref:NACHT domain-containing protein n=1 Tax=Macrolepiota fuliginosa MF-IS2 TaxID=1400762 RepID=A0A9P6C0Z4_9AGAR|nr:hypothetical protein P691DRAFT_290098 [Macrolepiota fuliginosa MF-IS2]
MLRINALIGHISSAGNGGVFTGAHHFSIGQMNATETQNVGEQSVGMQNITTQNVYNYVGPNSLEKMLPYIIPGAEYNSAARDPPPRCHPDTRTKIRADLQDRFDDGTRMVWMHGPAGVGKSAIMQTIAEAVSPQTTCTTLFFSRYSDPPRNESRKVFATLAYRVAADNLDYRNYIEERMSQDPAFLERSLDEQFRRLFLAPFINHRVQAGSHKWVVLLDGLDECQNRTNEQCRIVNLIRDSILHHAEATPFFWIIASRPEDHLMTALLEIKEDFQDRPGEFWEFGIPVDSDEATRDVERYLHTEFIDIRKKHSKSFPNPTSIWPSDGDFLKVARASSGLFVFASTLTKYVSEGSPASRLKLIVALIDRSTHHPTRVPQKPFNLLDALYSQIMSDIPKDQLSITKSLLGFFRLTDAVPTLRVGSVNKVGLIGACNILGLWQDEAYESLRRLHSVVICPSPEMAQTERLRFFHASFPEFLLDRSRSEIYHVDLDQELTNVWRSYIRILRESSQSSWMAPKLNPDSVNVPWIPEDDDSCLAELQKDLLSKAQQGWVSILIKYGHSWCASCPRRGNDRRLAVDVPELLDVFRSIHLMLFRSLEFPVEKFMEWLNDHAPNDVREKMILQKFPVSQLDSERLCKSLYIRPWWQWSHSTGSHIITLTQEVSVHATH